MEPSVEVDLELLGQPGQVDVELDPVRRNGPKGVSIVSLRRCLEEADRAAAAARGPRPDEEFAAALADELDRVR